MEPFGKKLRIKSKANAPVLFFREDDEAWLHSRENCAHARKEIRKNAHVLECLLVQDYRKLLLSLPASDFVISALTWERNYNEAIWMSDMCKENKF